MSENSLLKTCPVCNGQTLRHFLNVKDYYFTLEPFTLIQCLQCEVLITAPQPVPLKLGKYYNPDNYDSYDSGSKTSLFSKLYRLVRKYTIRYKYHLIEKRIGTVGHMLDIGCGTGEILAYSSKKGWVTTGIEPAEKPRILAQNRYGLDIVADIGLLDSNIKYDVISLWHVFEHFSDPLNKFSQIIRLLNKDGFIFIAVPDYNSYDARHYKEYWAAYDVPRHLFHYTEKTIRHIASLNKMVLVATKKLYADAFYISMLSEQYRHKRARIVCSIFIGLVSNVKSLRKTHPASSQVYILRKEASG